MYPSAIAAASNCPGSAAPHATIGLARNKMPAASKARERKSRGCHRPPVKLTIDSGLRSCVSTPVMESNTSLLHTMGHCGSVREHPYDRTVEPVLLHGRVRWRSCVPGPASHILARSAPDIEPSNDEDAAKK